MLTAGFSAEKEGKRREDQTGRLSLTLDVKPELKMGGCRRSCTPIAPLPCEDHGPPRPSRPALHVVFVHNLHACSQGGYPLSSRPRDRSQAHPGRAKQSAGARSMADLPVRQANAHGELTEVVGGAADTAWDCPRVERLAVLTWAALVQIGVAEAR